MNFTTRRIQEQRNHGDEDDHCQAVERCSLFHQSGVGHQWRQQHQRGDPNQGVADRKHRPKQREQQHRGSDDIEKCGHLN